MATAVMIVAVVMFIVEMPADDGFSVVAPFYLCMLFDRFFFWDLHERFSYGSAWPNTIGLALPLASLPWHNLDEKKGWPAFLLRAHS